MIFNKKFNNKKEELHYIEVCFKIWGGAPVDVDWAIQTPIWKNTSSKILKDGRSINKRTGKSD